MKKLLGSIKKPKGSSEERSNGYRNSTYVPTGDGPEAVVYREVASFCESGAPGSNSAGDEYLHLPAIVDAAESSPSAANQAAVRIRGYLGKDHYDRGFAQYNAIMLTRILTDNPGRVFTQNFDKEFIATVKRLLREGRDSSVQQILRETLDYFEVKSHENDTLLPLMEMWRKEKGAGARIVYPRSSMNRGPPMPPRPKALPPPGELAARIEEAKTTARLLVQTVQSTPTNELLSNDLVREFAERVRMAQKSVQGFINAENPHPDDETMLTLIETSEQLNVATTKHQRAVLQARKATGVATPSPQPQDPSRTQYMGAGENVYGQSPAPQSQPQQQQYQQWQEPQATLSPPAMNGQGRTSSPRNEAFAPPPGPPPGRPTSNVYSDYQTQPSNFQNQQTPYMTQPSTNFSQPSTFQPQSNAYQLQPSAPKTSTAAASYEVADNPFTDAATYEQSQARPPQQQNYSLFGNEAPRPTGTNAYGQPASDNPYSQPPPTSPQRPGAYNPGYTSTPSYMHRQDSAAANITMHGASPPSEPRH